MHVLLLDILSVFQIHIFFLIFLKSQITNIFKKKKLAVLKFYKNNKLENKIQA